MPGPTGSPLARSHTIVDARWLVIPTASTDSPASTSVAHASAASAIATGSNSTRPGAGEEGSTSR
jgi:hypothetical protein